MPRHRDGTLVIVLTNGRLEIAQEFGVAGRRSVEGADTMTKEMIIIYLAAVVVTFSLLYIAAGLIFVGVRVLVHLARELLRALVLMFATEPRRRRPD